MERKPETRRVWKRCYKYIPNNASRRMHVLFHSVTVDIVHPLLARQFMLFLHSGPGITRSLTVHSSLRTLRKRNRVPGEYLYHFMARKRTRSTEVARSHPLGETEGRRSLRVAKKIKVTESEEVVDEAIAIVTAEVGELCLSVSVNYRG